MTKLAKIADLKVISRTSVMGYRGKQNMRQIGDELRVSHVLEGSVRRDGAQLRLNAQLIDTRTDTHVWAEQYDRDLNDLFAIQSETAQKVAERLHAKITAAEKLAIEGRPTGDLVAFDLYSQANHILPGTALATEGEVRQAIDLLNQAVARDPSFFGAYCQLAWAHDELYFSGLGPYSCAVGRRRSSHSGRGSAFVQMMVKRTSRAGINLYHGHLDYEGALAELEVARQTLPNELRVFQPMGFILRRQGHWEEWMRNFERAVEINPRYINPLYQSDLITDSCGAMLT